MITIHRLEDKHKTSWAELWKQYLSFYDTARSKAIFDLTFSQLIDNNEECDGYIAFYAENTVGIVHCIYHLHLWQQEKICYLQDLFVNENYRNRGIARKLISRVYDRADEKNMEGVYWMTQNFNTTAQKLYDKIGEKTPFIKYKRV